MNPHDHLQAVHDQASFLEFVRALLEDRRAASDRERAGAHSDWANSSLADFLEGALAWAEDSEFGDRQNWVGANPWQRFAVFLYCGKIYE
ncbi:DUF7660 family protein [Phytopseudomonas dryadis]|uniref:DUF7660 domain-containing protein n=1 Tax=Phytopseudomonas dryadis TaxID=2487520 RepID=A0A4Q9QUN4_9GAMM|nr:MULTISPECIES: hypothetical protein [Pseudomonas]TBU85624.1 hypothetical protein DNK44_24180 [Pseudomonas dryadis]TBU99496.1 hypothetical protein DNK34_24570 [Pseudomonas dryadis]TBV12547.1 hypothetical protein DNK41_24485 [Pseudomonas sp. FRB 230]